MTRASWWDRATTEQKLAQIDAAIELEIHYRVLAKNLGVPLRVLLAFAASHRRRIGDNIRYERKMERNRQALERRRKWSSFRRAYFEGGPVDFWGLA